MKINLHNFLYFIKEACECEIIQQAEKAIGGKLAAGKCRQTQSDLQFNI